MSNQDNELRNLFREKIDGMEVTPPEKVWTGVEKTMFSGNNWGAIALWFGAAAVLCCLLYFFMPFGLDREPANNRSTTQGETTGSTRNQQVKESLAKQDQESGGEDKNKYEALPPEMDNANKGTSNDELEVPENANSGLIGSSTFAAKQPANEPIKPKKTPTANGKSTAEKTNANATPGSITEEQELLKQKGAKIAVGDQQTVSHPDRADSAKVHFPVLPSVSTLSNYTADFAQPGNAYDEVLNHDQNNDNRNNPPATGVSESDSERADIPGFMPVLMSGPLAMGIPRVNQLSYIPEVVPGPRAFHRHYYQLHASLGREIRTFEISNPKNQNLLDKSVALKHRGIGFNYQYQFHAHWALHTGVYAYRTRFITRLFPISIANQNLDGELVFDTPEGEFKSEPLELSSYAEAGQDTSVFLGRIVHRSGYVSLPLAIRYNTTHVTGINFYAHAGVRFNVRASERNTLVIRKSDFERNISSVRAAQKRKMVPVALVAMGLQTQPKGRMQYFTELNYARVLGRYHRSPHISIRSQFVTVGVGLRMAF